MKKTIMESVTEAMGRSAMSSPSDNSSWRGTEKPEDRKPDQDKRYKLSPKINNSDLYVSGGITDEEGVPSITDPEIEKHLEDQLGQDEKPQLDLQNKPKDNDMERPTAYRGKNAPDPNDNFDITGPIDPMQSKRAPANPTGQIPQSVLSRIEKEILDGDPKKIDKLKSILETDFGEEEKRKD
jgi:hypothetical protein